MGFKALLIVFLFLLHVDARGEAVALISPQAKDFVGQQLSSFQVDADGVISSTENRYLRLNNTQGKSFKLSGQVWLGGTSSDATLIALAPDGFLLRLRWLSSNHTFRLSSRSIQIDHVKAKGIVDDKVDEIATFDQPTLNVWIPFSVEAALDHITYQFGSQNGSIPGPLETDGTNSIWLAAGTKLKDLQLELLDDSTDQATASPPAATTSDNPPTSATIRKLNLSPATTDFLKAMVIIKGEHAQGSGFIVKKNGQLCVATNQHVLSGNSNFTITGVDGTKYPTTGALFGAVDYDVAMLRIPAAANFITIDDNSDADAKIDDTVQVLGNADGGGVVTKIAGKLLGIGPDLVEVNAKFIPGNSGSPIIDLATHKVIGIATYIKTVYTQTELEKAADAPPVRWFGYRLDTIKQWETLDWPRFSSEATRLEEIQTRTSSFVQLFQLLAAKTPTSAHLKDSNIDLAYTSFFQSEERAIADNNKRDVLFALKTLISTLTPFLDNDTSAMSDLKLYSFHANELKAQTQIREVVRHGFQDTLANIENMSNALNPK
jgi:hypothetical protein